ncbi:hypothetical protein [Alkalicoccobacillus murimartini]|uniref:Nitrogen fixation-related uncharacterized protein n=1 Tax=Alkalicoccobacillus murimartini TaxID=171685 RepID=A0ABT9YC69_9BACI|nr:hypothetical protein [Alkalicoccobacillus murimartini]MDQ0205443.1 nitrogen fixation-related uncharacterized protein [Alkalicoccobacillus murimartini]
MRSLKILTEVALVVVLIFGVYFLWDTSATKGLLMQVWDYIF